MSKSAKKGKPLFDKKWWKDVDKTTQEDKKYAINDWRRIHAKMGNYSLAFYCLSTIALQDRKPSKVRKIFKENEKVCNRFGITLMEFGKSTRKCLTRHSLSKSYYDNPYLTRIIKCKCSCHVRKSS